MKKPYTKEQPQDGDTVLSCGHTADRWHWWKFLEPVDFVRPDGTHGMATWLIACHPCRDRAAHDPARILVRSDGRWQGNAPIVYEGKKS